MCDEERKINTDEFRFITGKKKTSRKLYNRILPQHCGDDTNTIDKPLFLSRLKKHRDDMKISKYFIKSLSVLEESLSINNNEKIDKFVCFGLGSFTTCLAAFHQLAFSLEICDSLKISNSIYYDPIFSLTETDILNSLKCQIMSENCEGKYGICGRNVTILYLPHCPKQLINNFLWHNWNLESLQKSILICNSFEKIIENTPERILKTEAKYIKKIGHFLKEFVLENCYQYEDIFNDTSIHIFGNYGQDELKDFWIIDEPPQYNDIELITAEAEKNNKYEI